MTSARAPLYTPAFCLLFLSNLCTVSSFGAFFLFPLFISERGGSESDIGILMGCFALASALCRPWISEMIDRIGRKRSYGLGCLGMCLTTLCYLLLQGDLDRLYLPLLALRCIHGVALAICFTTIFTWVADLIPPARLGEGIGIFGISGLLGMALGPAIGEWALALGSYPLFFPVSCLLASVGLFAHLPLQETFVPSAETPKGPSFFSLLRRAKMARVAVLTLFFGFAVAASSNFVAPLVTERGLGIIAPFYLAYSGAAIGVRFFGSRLGDLRGERALLPWGLGVTALGLLLLAVTHRESVLILAGMLAGTGHGILFPALNSLAIRGEPLEIRGRVTGIFTGSIDAGLFVGSMTLGWVGDLAGYQSLFYFAAGLMALMTLLAFRPFR